MLDAKKNDFVDYSDLLKPPAGYTLTRAIATTYSLDLQALLSVPVAMFYSKPLETDFNKFNEPLDVFDSIERASEIVTIFCQKGKIKVPVKFNKLISFTEECVKEIIPKSAFSSFHPKCWWLWFSNHSRKERIVRVAVLSRNLTFDRSWDISLQIEGKVTQQVYKQNQPFIDMLAYLEKATDYKIDHKLKRDLARANLKTDLPIKSWSFYPIGISKNHTNPLQSDDFKPEQLLLMSPFVHDSSIHRLSQKTTGKVFLFSRRTELAKLKLQSFNSIHQAFCIPDVIVNGELDESKSEQIPNTEPGFLDLHAKLYIAKKGRSTAWYLGSANLTEPAFSRNIECLFQFTTDDGCFSLDSIYKDLVSSAKEKKLFEEYFPSESLVHEQIEDIDRYIRELEYEIINCRVTGKILPDENGNYYAYEIIFDAERIKKTHDIKIYLQPLISRSKSDSGALIQAGKYNTLLFDEGYSVSQLSKYFAIHLVYKNQREKSFLMMVEMELPSLRKARIIAEIINSKEKFLQYLQLLLSDTGIIKSADSSMFNRQQSIPGKFDLSWIHYNIPLYEELLRAASKQPQKLKHIDAVINKLLANEETKPIISNEFIQLWSVFKDVIK